MASYKTTNTTTQQKLSQPSTSRGYAKKLRRVAMCAASAGWQQMLGRDAAFRRWLWDKSITFTEPTRDQSPDMSSVPRAAWRRICGIYLWKEKNKSGAQLRSL